MNKFKVSFAAITMIGLLLSAAAIAGGSGGRYYVSGSGLGLGVAQAMVENVHHQFEHGFTGDLSPGQVRALEVLGGMFGVSAEPVELYYVTAPPGSCSPWPDCKNGGGDGGAGEAGRQYYPAAQIPWGVAMVYGNSSSSIENVSGGAGIDVAVLDTGVYKDHLDLTRRVKQCKDFTGGGPPGSVNIRNGKCDDRYGHGTHVAGTILADGGADGKGIYGVAPEAALYAYKVCGNDGSCWADDIASAISHAADQGAEIISLSLGGNTQSSLVKDAVDYAVSSGALVVAAAGNDGPDTGSIDYPGANVKVAAVGAIDYVKQVPDWSSRGINDGDGIIEEKEVEFGVPGVNIESAWLDGKYNTISGTSMAAPHVSGLAAKLWQGTGSATRTYLQGLVEDIWTAGDDPATGLGLPHM